MIRYVLRCDQGHDFESWFRSSDAYDALHAAGQVTCAMCGSTKVEKTLMAPRIASAGSDAPDLHTPKTEQEIAIDKLRKHLVENSDYVGMTFAAEARAIHEGNAPDRAIYGEAKLEDAKKLLEDGIPVAPLPFMSRNNAN